MKITVQENYDTLSTDFIINLTYKELIEARICVENLVPNDGTSTKITILNLMLMLLYLLGDE